MKSFKSLPLILVLLLAFSLTLAVPALAQEADDAASDENITAEDLGVAEPATGLFGFFQNMANGFQYALTFDPIKKAELKLEHANDALLRAQDALENNPDSIKAQEKYDKYLKKYEENMVKVQERVQIIKEKAEENPKVEQLLNQLTNSTFKQQRLMDHVSSFLDEDQKAKLQENREQSLKTMGEALKNLDNADKLPERLESAINSQAGSRLIHLKNLEVLEGLKNQLPEQALKGIENAQAKTLNRLNEALQNYDPEARRERFQAYMENSNSDQLTQIEALDTLEQSPNLLQEIKQNLPAIKNEKVEKIDNMIDAFKNDEHKIRNLERIRQIEDPQTKTLLREIEQKYVNPNTPANTPLKVDNLKETVRNSYKEGEKPVRMQEKIEGGVDKLKDVINKEEDDSLKNNVKDAVRQGVKEGEKPVRMQEKVEGGVDKLKDVNQQRVDDLHKENQTGADEAADSAN